SFTNFSFASTTVAARAVRRLYPAVCGRDNLPQVSGSQETGIRLRFGGAHTRSWLCVRNAFEKRVGSTTTSRPHGTVVVRTAGERGRRRQVACAPGVSAAPASGHRQPARAAGGRLSRPGRVQGLPDAG